MPTPIEEVASKAIRKPLALLLGAGSGIPSGAPSGPELAAYLTEYIDPQVRDEGRALSEVAEILEAKHGRRVVVKAVIDRLVNLTPCGGILSLPYFQWRAIYSTNFDRLIELAFEKAKKSLPVIRSDFDFDRLDDPSMLAYFKLHGCITQDRSLGAQTSLVLTEADYFAPSNYRDQLFNRLENDIAASGIVVLGHSLRDKHLSDLIRKLAGLQNSSGYRFRINIVVFEKDDDYALIYEQLGIGICYGGIDEFVAALEQARQEAPEVSATASLGAVEFPQKVLSFSRFIIPGNTSGARAERIYNGRPADYPDIEAGLTFRRDIEDTLFDRISAGNRVTAVIGVAGTGKTTVARRAIVQCAQQDIFCWEHIPNCPPNVEMWRDVNARMIAASRTGVLFIDDVTRYQRQANELVQTLACASPYGLRILVTAETGQWNPRQKDRAFLEDGGPIVLSSLTDAELRSMLDLATSQSYLASLMATSFSRVRPENRLPVLRARTEQDMFLALRMIFDNESLDNILLTEFSRLSENAQLLYKLVFGLQAAGLVVHRQLAVRMMRLAPTLIRGLLIELEGLVFEKETSQDTGLFVWESRHQRIAEILSKYKFGNSGEHNRLLSEAIEHWNPAEPIERQFASELCNSDFGIRGVEDHADRIGLYRRIIEKDPRTRIARHRLIAEFLRDHDIDGAEVQIREAENVIGIDPPIQRYKVLLALKQIEYGRELQKGDIEALLSRAKRLALEGMNRFSGSKYQYFAFADVAKEAYERLGVSEWLEEAVVHLRKGFQRLLEAELELKANQIESRLEHRRIK